MVYTICYSVYIFYMNVKPPAAFIASVQQLSNFMIIPEEPTENTATIQEPRQLWCYVNEDYLTDEQIQLPVDNNGAQFTTERDQQGLTKETDAKNETKLVKTDMEIEYKSKALTTNKYVKADMQIVRDGTPRISNTNKSFTETSHFPVPEQLEIKDNESNLSEQQSITDLHPGLATAKSHPLSNDYELQDDSDDYIPCSQMRTIRKPCQFIGTNLDTVAKDSGQLGAYAKESNTCSEVVSVPFSEDSDIVSGNQVIQEPSKMCQGKLFKSKLQETERYLSHNEIANLTGKLSKKTMYENSVSAKPACGPEIQYIKGLAFEYKVESRPNSLHFENQGIKVYDNTITPRVPVEDNSLDSTEDDMIIPPSGQSDETSMLQQVPGMFLVCFFLKYTYILFWLKKNA